MAGVIVEGPARDIDDSRSLDFPVFAEIAYGADGARADCRGRDGRAGRVGDVTVDAGDYAIADGSAVVFVAASEIERVLETAEAIMAREEAMAQALREGIPISQVMGANYEHMLKNQTS